jgi:hypothetical protein
MNQNSLFKSLRKGIRVGLMLWAIPSYAYHSEAQKVDLKKRDLHHLEHLKQELARAEAMPGGLERARDIKRQIQAIEQGTTIYTPDLMGFKDAPAKGVPQRLTTASSALTPAMPKAPSPGRTQGGCVSLTGGGKGGHDIDLFHDKTITVAQDYGVSEDVMRTHMKNAKETRETESLYEPLKMPGEGEESLYPSELTEGPAMQAPLYGLPAQNISGPVSTAAPSPRIDPTQTPVDAAQFHQSQQLYGNPSSGMSPQNSVVPPHGQYQQASVAWKADKSEAGYLEEQLKTKLSQLAHARRQLSSATGAEANAWTFRIHSLEGEKRSLLRMMQTLGVTPSFQKVSIKEDSEFDTIQSQEHLLRRQLYKTEKEEKKLRRQMNSVKDPEVITVMGDRLASLENDRKLLEASLRTLQQNSQTVDNTSFVAHPAVYRTPPSQPVIDEKEELHALGTTSENRVMNKSEAEVKEMEKNSSLGTIQEQRDRSGHPDYIERVPKLKDKADPEAVPGQPTSSVPRAHTQYQVVSPSHGAPQSTHDEEDEETSLYNERKDFWSAGLPSHMDQDRIPVEKPQPVDRNEARNMEAVWNRE